jgi:hypothetical protein
MPEKPFLETLFPNGLHGHPCKVDERDSGHIKRDCRNSKQRSNDCLLSFRWHPVLAPFSIVCVVFGANINKSDGPVNPTETSE